MTLASAFNPSNETTSDVVDIGPYSGLIAEKLYDADGKSRDVSSFSKKQMATVIDTLSKTKFGKELLDDALVYGTKIAFESITAYGSFNDETKVVLINSSNGFDRSVVTLAHELRHSQQFQKGVALNALLDVPKNYVQSQGMIEADANVVACVVAWDLKEQGNSKPLDAFKEEGRPLIKAFETEAEKGDMKAARRAAFYAWFDDHSIRRCYEKNYLKNWEARDNKATREERAASFTRDVGVMENIAKVCLFDGKCYLPKKETEKFFKKPEQNQVTSETWWAIVRNVARARPGFYMDNVDNVKKEMESPDGLRLAPSSFYEANLTERQKMAAKKISEYRSLDNLPKMRTNGAKFADASQVILAKKRNLIQK